MKCNKCGEECKDSQVFCLKCGNPIQVVPDFNLIEAELATNIGELMEEMDKEVDINASEDVDNISVNTVSMELKLVDISRDDRTKVIGDVSKVINEQLHNGEFDTTEDVVQGVITPQAKKSNKKKIAIIVGVVVLVLAIAIIAFLLIANKVDETSKSFDDYYELSSENYDSMDTKNALDNALIALRKAATNDEKIKIIILMNDIYVLAGTKNADYADNLAEIINLGSKNSNYYKELAKYYSENGKSYELTELLRGIEDEALLEAVADYYVKEPKTNKESGNYNEYMAIELSADEGCKIYFTTDSRNPSSYGEEYTEPIVIDKEGELVLKAVAINADDVESKIVTLTYKIELTGSSAPKLTPVGGAYVEKTKIKVEVPEGGKAYYTWDETNPNEGSTEYTEEIDMKRGINVLKVVVVDKYGIYSDIATESYNLQVERKLTLNEAVKLIENKVTEDSSIKVGEDETLDVYFETTVIDDNEEYYIVLAAVKDAEGKMKSVKVFGVNTYDKSVSTDFVEENGTYSIPKKEE